MGQQVAGALPVRLEDLAGLSLLPGQTLQGQVLIVGEAAPVQEVRLHPLRQGAGDASQREPTDLLLRALYGMARHALATALVAGHPVSRMSLAGKYVMGDDAGCRPQR
jgi:hypothetical protein